MAAPPTGYAELLQVAHNEGVGFKFRGAEIVARDLYADPSSSKFTVVAIITKAAGTWTVTYLAQFDGTVGRFVHAVDEQGRSWHWDFADGWA